MVTYEQTEPTWRKCDECDVAYFIGATLNPRNHKYAPIPLSLVPDNEISGNFQIDWRQELIEVYDADGTTLGSHPVVVYGMGPYRPHNPSHFLDDIHVQEGNTTHQPKPRLNNFRLRMDDDD